MKRAVFVGSFDPFTLGHKDIALRASELFDELIIAVSRSNGKNSRDICERKRIIELSIGAVPDIEVASFDGLTTDFMKSVQSEILVRGVRNAADFEYERSLMSVYKSLFPSIKFVLLPASPELIHISSSVVRELCKLNAPIGGYVDTKAEKSVRKLYME